MECKLVRPTLTSFIDRRSGLTMPELSILFACSSKATLCVCFPFCTSEIAFIIAIKQEYIPSFSCVNITTEK